MSLRKVLEDLKSAVVGTRDVAPRQTDPKAVVTESPDGFPMDLPFVFLHRRQRYLRFLRVRPMHRLAVVTERHLRESFGIARRLRPLHLRVAVGMQRHALNPQANATLMEFRGPVARTDGGEIWKERPCLRQGRKDFYENTLPIDSSRRSDQAWYCSSLIFSIPSGVVLNFFHSGSGLNVAHALL